MGDIRNFQTKFMPITRQSKGTGKATLVACFLRTTFETLYGRPMHKKVAALVNVLFRKERHTENSISSITQRSKKLTGEKNNIMLDYIFKKIFMRGISKNSLSLQITSQIQRKIAQNSALSKASKPNLPV